MAEPRGDSTAWAPGGAAAASSTGQMVGAEDGKVVVDLLGKRMREELQ